MAGTVFESHCLVAIDSPRQENYWVVSDLKTGSHNNGVTYLRGELICLEISFRCSEAFVSGLQEASGIIRCQNWLH